MKFNFSKEEICKELIANEGRTLVITKIRPDDDAEEQILECNSYYEKDDIITIKSGITEEFSRFKLPKKDKVLRAKIYNDKNGKLECLSWQEITGKEITIEYAS